MEVDVLLNVLRLNTNFVQKDPQPTFDGVRTVLFDFVFTVEIINEVACTCCKAIFRSSFGPSRRNLACCQRIPIHIFYRRDFENDRMVQMTSEKPLCSRWMCISTATPVNAKGLMASFIKTQVRIRLNACRTIKEISPKW